MTNVPIRILATFAAAIGRRLPVLMAALVPVCTYAGSGPFGIDHELALDQRGIWARKYQTGLEYGVVAV